MAKKFDKETYEKYDPLKQLIVDKFNRSKYYTAKIHPNPYSKADILVNIEGTNSYFYVEAQCKDRWEGPIFPYQTLDIEPRKEETAMMDSDEVPTFIAVINKDKTHFLMVRGKDILASKREDKVLW